jgi:hypothetical protein
MGWLQNLETSTAVPGLSTDTQRGRLVTVAAGVGSDRRDSADGLMGLPCKQLSPISGLVHGMYVLLNITCALH